ncbi:MAG: hybrid sensor histidine kinase/response regulator, partial [Sphingopyxis terrae]
MIRAHAAAVWVKARLTRRPDSEHGQAVVRLVIACLIVAYLYVLGKGPAGIDPSYSLMLQVMSVEATVGLGLLAGIVASPGVSHVRRAIGMFSDYATLLILMLIKPKDLAPLYV